jgi:hypothetical protein
MEDDVQQRVDRCVPAPGAQLYQQVPAGQRWVEVVVAEGCHGDQLNGLPRTQTVTAIEQARADTDGDGQSVRGDLGAHDAVVWLR